jgi:hypothetical protein
MKSKSPLIAVLLLICGAGAALVYASMDDRDSATAVSRSHEQQGTAGTTAHGAGRDHLDCHSHGAKTYHCH